MKEGDIFHGFWYILLDRVEAALELVEAVLAAVGLKKLGAGGVCPQAPRGEKQISPKTPRPADCAGRAPTSGVLHRRERLDIPRTVSFSILRDARGPTCPSDTDEPDDAHTREVTS